MIQSEKNKLIGDQRRLTAVKRKSQICKSFKFKVLRSSLTSSQKEQLKMYFVESKWIYNYLLSHQDGLFDIGTKYKELVNITHLDKDRNVVNVTISHVTSSIKQELIQTICNEIKGLSVLKKKGHNVGKLKFKSEINSINLKQYGNTHTIRGSRFKIQGIKQPIRVSGLKQISKYKNIDFANAKLLYDGYDYYITLTCYIDNEPEQNKEYKNDIIGLDFGVKTTITTSNGDKVTVLVRESDTLKKLQCKLARQEKGSKSWYKTRSLIRKQYTHLNNKKNDFANKIVHKLLTENKIIVMQNEQIAEWQQTDVMSEKVQHSVLGRIKSRLMQSNRVFVLDKWYPTTKYCSNCGSEYDIPLEERTYVCPTCGYKEDRDIHAAKNMIYFYQQYKDTVGTTDTSKPVKLRFTKNLLRSRKQQSL